MQKGKVENHSVSQNSLENTIEQQEKNVTLSLKRVP